MDNFSEFIFLFEKNFPNFTRFFYALTIDQQAQFRSSVEKKTLNEWKYFISLLKKNKAPVLNTKNWQEPRYLSVCNLVKHGYTETNLKRIGEACFTNGSIAMLTVAGGLGTRLNFNGPKGLVPVTPIRHKTLLQIFSEKLQALARYYHQSFHWLIMTSEETDAAIQSAFHTNNWYDNRYLHFFKQGTLPAFSSNGDCLLQSDGSVCYLPNGHGGVFHALKQADLLSKLETWGISTISYFQIDNPLVHLDDRLFLGAHLAQQSDFSTKVVAKKFPEERVGLFVQEPNILQLIEYSEFPKNLAQERNEDGELRYRWGNTAIHLLSAKFIQKCATLPLPYHVCHKKMAGWDPLTKKTQTSKGNKLEQFIFDALPYANNPLLWQVERSDEFSPVKNAEGNDTLLTCKQDQCQRWLSWLQQACKADPATLDKLKNIPHNLELEISPLFADNASAFLKKWEALTKRPDIVNGLYLE